jgi:hypothetical protein
VKAAAEGSWGSASTRKTVGIATSGAEGDVKPLLATVKRTRRYVRARPIVAASEAEGDEFVETADTDDAAGTGEAVRDGGPDEDEDEDERDEFLSNSPSAASTNGPLSSTLTVR